MDEFINPKTYILIKGENDIDTKIEYIKKIDNDDKLYMSIMKEKPIIDNKFIDRVRHIIIDIDIILNFFKIKNLSNYSKVFIS